MIYREQYTPILVGLNATVPFAAAATGGFLAKTAGTISITNSSGVLIVDTHPVSAGVYYPLPFFVGINGGTFTAAGGASGTLGI